jgi:hypothetical protein
MDSRDNVRERFEALERQTEQWPQHTRMAARRLPWWRGTACGGVLLSLVSLVSPSQAADFTCAAGDVACLIHAINTANANGEANTITLEAGTYTLTAVDNTTDGPNGLPSVTSTLTIQGAGADTTVIAREASTPLFRLGHVAATGTLTFERLTLRSSVETSGRLNGAGLFNQGGILTLDHVTLSNNNAGMGQGGGLFNNGGTVTLASTLLTRNVAEAGGGLFARGGTVLLINSTVASNGTLHGGGGLWNENGGVLSLIHSTLTHNSADNGGGLVNSCGSSDLPPITSPPCGVVTITESTIANNTAIFNEGGGIRNVGTLTLLNSTVATNFASNNGGGIRNAGSMIITNSTIADNQGIPGGGGIRNTGP